MNLPEEASSLLLKRRVFILSPEAETSLLRNVVFVFSVSMEKIQIHISDISHVTPVSKNYSVQSKNTLKMGPIGWSETSVKKLPFYTA